MDLLSLYTGLLLPWIGGTLWLVFVEARFSRNDHPNRSRQAGYGFFLGYAVLFAAILLNNGMTGSVSWSALMLFLSLFAAIGGLVVWLGHRPESPYNSSNTTVRQAPKRMALKLLTSLLLLWVAIHIFLFTVDIFNQPLYPWDAWLAWVYRAKAWFMAGSISNVVSASDWMTTTSTATYTIEAWMYPPFPSIIPYWAALCLGRWSETLVNTPVLFAGLAIGMALYGQCREYGLDRATSLICCYLLYSIPLLGTHIGLAGYADIWMAGYTGLGFVAVIRAAVMSASQPRAMRSSQMALGLLMLALGTLVKNEGMVWFLAALVLMTLVNFRARVPILIFVFATLSALLAFALDTTYINVPFVGELGLIDGRLFIPFIGNFALELHNIWQVYWTNFFEMGSWNLFWVLVLFCLFVSVSSAKEISARRVQKVTFAFFCVFLATQFFIFGLTDQGIWADTFTAINRLPLHYVPALLFASFLVVNSWFNKRDLPRG